jgi:glycosyltransferase involved in cell wall biosynthesis
LVSVLIPTFNYAHYIQECIESVRQQELENVEIIVVDDCSTDDTEAVVAALRAEDLRYVRHERNRGPAGARNTGLRLARGRYVALLDADDAMNPDNLSRKVEVLDRHPDVVLVHSAAVPIDEKGRALTPSRPTRATRTDNVRLEHPFPRILYENPVMASAAVVRKDALDRIGGFDPGLHRAEDWDLWVRLSRPFLFAYID